MLNELFGMEAEKSAASDEHHLDLCGGDRARVSNCSVLLMQERSGKVACSLGKFFISVEAGKTEKEDWMRIT